MDRNLALEVVRVTEAAALSASRWMGRGDETSADQAAVTAIEAGRPQDYDAAWRRETLRCRLLTQALVAAARRGRIRPLVVPAAARAPAVFRAAVGLLA